MWKLKFLMESRNHWGLYGNDSVHWKFFQKPSWAEIQALQVADGPDEEEILLPELRVWAPLGGAHCTTVLTVLSALYLCFEIRHWLYNTRLLSSLSWIKEGYMAEAVSRSISCRRRRQNTHFQSPPNGAQSLFPPQCLLREFSLSQTLPGHSSAHVGFRFFFKIN